jgi:hypothetical protein
MVSRSRIATSIDDAEHRDVRTSPRELTELAHPIPDAAARCMPACMATLHARTHDDRERIRGDSSSIVITIIVSTRSHSDRWACAIGDRIEARQVGFDMA